MFKKLKDKKGFTLVELIVVLVILAILAALLIPALTGYIDKANQEKVVAETRMVVMAVQTEATTYYGANSSAGAISGTIADKAGADATKAQKDNYDEIVKLAEVKGLSADTPTATFEATVGTDGAVKVVKYENGSYTCVYTASSADYKVEKNANGATKYNNTVAVG